MGNALAIRERTPLAEGVPSNKAQLREELAAVAQELNVVTTFMGWQGSLQYVSSEVLPGADVFLLVFDIDKWAVEPTGYRDDEISLATERYLTVEKEIAQGANKQAVLVGVDSLRALRKAYPSYYIDTKAFLIALNRAIA
jgi:putative GTP pyrophosphokinase